MTSHIVLNTSDNTLQVTETVIYMPYCQSGLKCGEKSSKSAFTSNFHIIVSPQLWSTNILNTSMRSRIVSNKSENTLHVIRMAI